MNQLKTLFFFLLSFPLVISAQNVGIGLTNPLEKLHVAGNLRVNNLANTSDQLIYADVNGTLQLIGPGLAGQVLTSNGTGVAPGWANGSSGWALLGNAGTNPATNFVGTTDAQALAIRANSAEAMRVHPNGNIGIGTTSSTYRLYVRVDNVNSLRSIYAYNNSSTNSTKYGIYNSVSNVGNGGRTGFYNTVVQNSASTAVSHGIENRLTGYGTGARYGYRGYVYPSTANTSGLYGIYQQISNTAATGPRYGVYADMPTSPNMTGLVYGQYSNLSGTGTGTFYGSYNAIIGTGTGSKYGTNNYMDAVGTNYGTRNDILGGSTGTKYATYNTISNSGNNSHYGEYTYLNGMGTGTKYGNYISVTESAAGNSPAFLRGVYANVYPNSTSALSSYGLYGYVGSAGTGTHYGVYGSAYGAGNRAVYGTNSEINGWAAYFNGRGYVSGRMGVGIDAPERKLHVRDNTNSTEASMLVQNINAGIDADATVNMRTNYNNAITNFSIGINNSMSEYLQFSESDWVGANIRMVIAKTTGNIGMGTSFPTQRLHVVGTIQGTTKSFLIDHPDDPQNKTLRHFSTESDEALVMYRGKVQLDANGEATVNMPGYFVSLTKEDEATINLTAIGKQPFLSSYEWDAGYSSFTVYGQPNKSVAYQVNAERDDPAAKYYLKDQPVVESKGPNKAAPVGSYLNPEAYGQTKNAGVNVDPAGKPAEKELISGEDEGTVDPIIEPQDVPARNYTQQLEKQNQTRVNKAKEIEMQILEEDKKASNQ